jgi:hypothetical protein
VVYDYVVDGHKSIFVNFICSIVLSLQMVLYNFDIFCYLQQMNNTSYPHFTITKMDIDTIVDDVIEDKDLKVCSRY